MERKHDAAHQASPAPPQPGPTQADPAQADAAQAGHAQADRAQDDHAQAGRERAARERLLRLGADQIEARPWRPAPAPLSAVDLAQFAVWRWADLGPEDILSALTLLPAARAEVEGLEAALLFTARSAGLTWAQMAEAMGFNSPQACQQRYTRLTARQDSGS
ncbi:DNA-binding protein [Nonomuraea candida]|uniref:DNA-binding protein n=1 Tax=Nonomuraea candida TaxID=359159 RepID=UPI001FE06566|nr:DNA-binding protein [Nonomuraea candida]